MVGSSAVGLTAAEVAQVVGRGVNVEVGPIEWFVDKLGLT